MKIYRKQEYEAWQYGPLQPWPDWVRFNTQLIDNELFLIRRSGKQLVKVTEWLYLDNAGEIVHMSNAEFNRDWSVR